MLKRFTAFMLAFALLFAPITPVSAFQTLEREVFSFEPLSFEEMSVPWGTTLEELNLPTELLAEVGLDAIITPSIFAKLPSLRALQVSASELEEGVFEIPTETTSPPGIELPEEPDVVEPEEPDVVEPPVLEERRENINVPVTWESDYDGEAVGVYTFNAILGEGFRLADGVSAPQIIVEVEPMGVMPFVSVTTEEELRAALFSSPFSRSVDNDVKIIVMNDIFLSSDLNISSSYPRTISIIPGQNSVTISGATIIVDEMSTFILGSSISPASLGFSSTNKINLYNVPIQVASLNRTIISNAHLTDSPIFALGSGGLYVSDSELDNSGIRTGPIAGVDKYNSAYNRNGDTTLNNVKIYNTNYAIVVVGGRLNISNSEIYNNRAVQPQNMIDAVELPRVMLNHYVSVINYSTSSYFPQNGYGAAINFVPLLGFNNNGGDSTYGYRLAPELGYLNIINSKIYNNSSMAVFTRGIDVLISGSEFYNNTSAFGGGAIKHELRGYYYYSSMSDTNPKYINLGINFDVSNSKFLNNKTTSLNPWYRGGAINLNWNSELKARIDDKSVFNGNRTPGAPVFFAEGIVLARITFPTIRWQGWLSDTVPSTSVSVVAHLVNDWDINWTNSYDGNSVLTIGYLVDTVGTGTSAQINGQARTSHVVASGSTVNLTAGTRTGYVFNGWTRVPNGTFSPNANSATASFTMPAQDVTVTANWRKQHTVSFNLNGGTSATPANQTVLDGAFATRPANNPTRAGHDFRGWFLSTLPQTAPNSDAWNFATNAVTSDITLQARWQIRNYQVKVIPGGGNTGSDFTVNHGANLNIGSMNTSPTWRLPMSGAYHPFLGWSTDINGVSPAPNLNFNFNRAITAALNIHGFWGNEPFIHTINFDVNGGEPQILSQNVSNGALPVEPADPVREGFTFDGWFNGSQLFDFTRPVGGSNTETPFTIDLEARWTEIYYSVDFELNGGDLPVPSSQTVLHGDYAIQPSDPVRDGYDFRGWFVSTLPQTAPDSDAYNFTMSPVKSDLVLEARWVLKTYQVKVLPGGGNNGADFIVDHGDVPALGNMDVSPTWKLPMGGAYHPFLGWSTDINGVSPAPNLNFNFNITITEPLTFYGFWEDEPFVHIVDFDVNGGEPQILSQRITNGTRAFKPANPVREGFTFDGWYNGSQLFNFDLPIGDENTDAPMNINLEARWIEIYYSVDFELNGGTSSAPPSQRVTHNGFATRPADPARSGYDFRGWFLSDLALSVPDSSAWNFETSPITSDITLEARWEQKDEGNTGGGSEGGSGGGDSGGGERPRPPIPPFPEPPGTDGDGDGNGGTDLVKPPVVEVPRPPEIDGGSDGNGEDGSGFGNGGDGSGSGNGSNNGGVGIITRPPEANNNENDNANNSDKSNEDDSSNLVNNNVDNNESDEKSWLNKLLPGLITLIVGGTGGALLGLATAGIGAALAALGAAGLLGAIIALASAGFIGLSALLALLGVIGVGIAFASLGIIGALIALATAGLLAAIIALASAGYIGAAVALALATLAALGALWYFLIFKRPKVTLNYCVSGKKSISFRVKRGALLVIPVKFARDGYELDELFLSKDFTKAWDMNEKITKSVTLYATWSPLP